jgi:hypothetical protein
VAAECDGADRLIKNGCPLQCRLRNGAVTDDLVADEVDWAGLRINLDYAFSRVQRDKVYAQHLMRRRGAQLGLWLQSTQVCVCVAASESVSSG